MESVDHRVSRDKHTLRIHAFRQQVSAGCRRGRKMPCRQGRRQPAVHFLWKGLAAISCTEAGFDVSHGNVVVKGSQGSYERRGCVTLDQHAVGPTLLE